MNTIKKFIGLINRDIANENESKSFTVILRWSYCLMAVYFLCYFIYCILFHLYMESADLIPWVLMIAAGLWLTYHISSSKNFIIFTLMLLSWAVISVLTFGWNCGSQHFMMPLLIMCFFSKGHVCRWGGEEFFFFFPGMNLDAAGTLMTDINIAVSRHCMYDHLQEFYITMTFGVEEYDYHSDISTLISLADEKLYYGKEHGRNMVVF